MTNYIWTEDGFIPPCGDHNSTITINAGTILPAPILPAFQHHNLVAASFLLGTTVMSLQELSESDPACRFFIPEGQSGKLSITDQNQNEIRSYTAPLNSTASELLKEVTETMGQQNNPLQTNRIRIT